MDLALNNLQRLICHKTKPNHGYDVAIQQMSLSSLVDIACMCVLILFAPSYICLKVKLSPVLIASLRTWLDSIPYTSASFIISLISGYYEV